MSDFDDDPILRDELQRLAGHVLDDDAAYARLQARVGVAKRRRAAAAIGAVAAAVLVVAGTTAFVGRDQRSIEPVANSASDDPVITAAPTSSSTTSTEATTTTTEAPTTTSTVPETSAPAAVPPTEPPPLATAAGNSNGGQSSSNGSHGSNTNGSNGGSGTNGSGSKGSGGGSGQGSPSSTSPTVASGENSSTHTYGTKGGSIIVSVKNGVMTLTATDARPGFTKTIDKNEPDHIRVYFTNSQDRYRIDVVLENGHVIETSAPSDDSTVNTFSFPSGQDNNDRGRDGGSFDSSGSGSGHG